MARPDIADAVSRLPFQPVALTDASWPTRGRVTTYSPPTDEIYRERVGTARSITLAFDDPTASEPWALVESARNPPGSPQQKARSMLGFGLVCVEAAARGELTPDGSCGAWERAAQAALEQMYFRLDGNEVEFQVLQASGVIAASAALADCTVTLSGRFDPRRIALQVVTDITRYIA